MFTATLPMSRLTKLERRSDNGTRIKKNFGFGCMRLPMKDGEVDHNEFSRMVDEFLQNGFNYFDTAHGYLDGKSETALKACLTSRYYYNVVHTGGGKAKASECIKCGKCEKACPQHLHIRDLLVDVAKEFEHH